MESGNVELIVWKGMEKDVICNCGDFWVSMVTIHVSKSLPQAMETWTLIHRNPTSLAAPQLKTL